MAWTNSKVFRPLLNDFFVRTTSFVVDFDADAFKAALYDNTITPDNDVTSANSAYAAGVWSATGGGTGTPQVFQAGQWAQAGVALAGVVLNAATADTVFFDANDTASGSAATLSNIFGTLVYDDTVTTPVADQGVSYNYFGGTNAVSNGTFTIVWNANGIWRATL